MKIAIGSDHAGFELKEFLRENLDDSSVELADYGTKSEESVDYPEYGFNVANDVSKGNIGFNSDDNAVTVFWGNQKQSFEINNKQIIARQLIECIADKISA